MAPWTTDSDRRLLLSIISVLSPSPPKWEEVVKLMGPGFTTESTRQRYQKLKKTAVADLTNTMNKDPDAVKTPTPRKRKNANGKKTGSAETEDRTTDEPTPKKIKPEPGLANGDDEAI